MLQIFRALLRPPFFAFLMLLASTAHAADEPKSDYRFFSTWDEVSKYYNDFETFLSRQAVRPFRKLVSSADARYSSVERLVRSVFEAYQTLYPELKSLPVPPVLIAEETTEVNAYAFAPKPGDPDRRAPYLFVVLTTALSNDTTEDELSGLIAHELAHLLFFHTREGEQAKISKFFNTTENRESLGLEQENDPNAKNTADAWIKLARLGGSFPLPEFHGISVSIGPSIYSDLQNYLKSRYYSVTNPQCGKVKKAYENFSKFIVPRISLADMTIHLGSGELDRLSVLSQELTSQMTYCLKEVRIDLVKLLSEKYGISEEVLRKNMAGEESIIELFNSYPNVMVGLFAIASETHARMRALEAKQGLKLIRNYTFEEQADDLSVRVLLFMHKQPDGVSRFLLNHALSARDKKRCLETLQSGQIPNYGALNDPHHSVCYRIYHVAQMAFHFIEENEGR